MRRADVTRIVVDCSVAAKWRLSDEDYVADALEILRDRAAGAIDLLAPAHFHAEVIHTFLVAWRRGRITQVEATDSVASLLRIEVELLHSADMASRALEIATDHGRSGYDSLYAALAEREGLEFWTGDERLFNALNPEFGFVRFIRDYVAQR